MRHQKRFKKLSRDSSHRKALLKNLIANLFLHGEIKTTLSKAKAVKGLADKLISKVKKASLHEHRFTQAFLQNKKAAEKLFKEIGPRFSQQTSGFTRIIHLGRRRGDDAIVAKIELVDKGEKLKKNKESKLRKAAGKTAAPKKQQ